MMKKVRKMFSESVKQESVRQIELGVKTQIEVAKLYGISSAAVSKWVKKYGTLPKGQRVVIESESDYTVLKERERRITELERAIGKMHMELSYFKEVIKHATLHYSEDIEKKFGKQ